MADVIASGLLWLGEQLREHAGRSVSYQRGTSSVTLLGTKGRSDFAVSDIAGTPIQTNIRVFDWIFTTDELVLDSAATLPQAGDKIVDGSVTYQVEAPGLNLQPWRYTDHHRQSIRVHTKQVV